MGHPLEDRLGELENALLPRYPMADAAATVESVQMGEVPPVIADEGVRLENRGLSPVLAPPSRSTRTSPSTPSRRPTCTAATGAAPPGAEASRWSGRRQGHDLLAEAGSIQHRLVVLPHRRELLRADVEGVVDAPHPASRTGRSPPPQVLHVEQLVAVVAAADHREAPPVLGPVVEQREHAQPLRPDERLRPDDRHAHALLPILQADLLRLDLGDAVRAHAVELVGLDERVMVGNAVHRRGAECEPPLVLRYASR